MNTNNTLIFAKAQGVSDLLDNTNIRFIDAEHLEEGRKSEELVNFYIPKGYFPVLVPIKDAEKAISDFVTEEKSMTLKPSMATEEKNPPRPANAFMLYRKEKQREVRMTNKNLSNKDVSKAIGTLWRNEDYLVKQEFLKKSEYAKLLHQNKYPDYKYCPKKKSKKREKPTESNSHADIGNFQTFDQDLNLISNPNPPQSLNNLKQPQNSYLLDRNEKTPLGQPTMAPFDFQEFGQIDFDSFSL